MKIVEKETNPKRFVEGLDQMCVETTLEADEGEDPQATLSRIELAATKRGLEYKSEELHNRRVSISLIATVRTEDDFVRGRANATRVLDVV